MLHTIENSYLKCTIESEGAEIRSLKDKVTGEEFVWQIDPKVWGSSSPVLFPAIGKIKGDKIVYENQEYTMPKHGIIRYNNQLSFLPEAENKCSFKLKSSPETLKQYPFKFSFTVVYSIIEKTLKMEFIIENLDRVPLYFACGGHTAYACAINKNMHLSDYVVEFPSKVNLLSNTLGSSGLLTQKKRKVVNNTNLLALSDTLFNEDALIFSDIDFDWIRLRKKNRATGVIVRFTNFPNLALWSKPGADYVCIEPWLGLPDNENESMDVTQKTNYKYIDAGKQFSISIDTEIE